MARRTGARRFDLWKLSHNCISRSFSHTTVPTASRLPEISVSFGLLSRKFLAAVPWCPSDLPIEERQPPSSYFYRNLTTARSLPDNIYLNSSNRLYPQIQPGLDWFAGWSNA